MAELKLPARRALAALDQPKKAAAADPRPRRISAKVRAGIEALVNGEAKTIQEAAEKAGMRRETLSRALSEPHVADHLQVRTRRRLAIQTARAGYVKGDLLDSASEITRDRASSFILGLAGIAPASEPTVSVNLNVRAGFVIDLRSDEEIAAGIEANATRTIPHV